MEKGGVVSSKESPPPPQCDPNEPGSCCGSGTNSMAYLRRDQLFFALLFSSPLTNICNAPLSRLTILSQVQGMYSSSSLMSLPREISSIVKGEGLKALWKGNLTNIAHLPCLAITLIAGTHLNHFMQSALIFDTTEDRQPSAIENFVGDISLMSSLGIASSAVYPMDLVRTRLAAQRSKLHYKGIGHAFRTIYKEEGLLGLYKGNGASLLRQASTMTICAYGMDKMFGPLSESQRPDASELLRCLGSLSICGLISSMATHPIDLVKKRLQLDGGGGQPRLYNDGLFGTFKSIVKTEGARGLYRGVLPDFLKVFPRVGFFFMFYEIFKRMNAFSNIVYEEPRVAEPRHS